MSRAIYIAGPTASGKSAVALILAEQLGAEVISVDSMQVYRGMDIGTAKLSAEELRKVPHHLIDIVDVSDPFDVAKFLEMARAVENDIKARGKVPIFCGGTGLYFNALASGIGTAPAGDPKVREELENTALPDLLSELAGKDPVTFARIDRANPRRVMRAIEVIRASGQPAAKQRSDWESTQPGGEWFGLEWDRAALHERIDRRVDRMFGDGLVEETRRLLGQGLENNRTAMQAIGYRQVVEYLNGGRNLESTIELVKQKTRQYAKRQMTWFRRQLDLEWINAGCRTAEQLARQIQDLLQARSNGNVRVR